MTRAPRSREKRRIASFVDPLAGFEAPHLAQLRAICEAIGYGRTIQVVEDWYEEKHPGWKAASDSVAAKRHAAHTKKPRAKRTVNQ